MRPPVENSPLPARASNDSPGNPWKLLGKACRQLARAGPAARVEALLDLTVRALGAERAFLVQSDRRGQPVVRATRSLRKDGFDRPSRTLLARSVASQGSFVCVDLAAGGPHAGASVRGLGLRAAVAAPVPLRGPGSAALLLDSRAAPLLARPQIEELAEAFAHLIALVFPATPGRSDDEPDPFAPCVSTAMRRMRNWVARVAPNDLPVLIRGETGSGKEGVARELHRLSLRCAGPFVAVNCTALTESLLDAELFGATRGAYTGSDRDRPGLFRMADGGTLLLDEVGDMSPPMQAKLLRALEERRVRPVGGDREYELDVRILAATHRDLRDRASRGAFRADLYHRLAVLEVRVPPLRFRAGDLPGLVENLGFRLRKETGLGPPRLTRRALRALSDHRWPGNVRELYAVLARALLRSGSGRIGVDDLRLPAPDLPWPEQDPPRVATLEEEMIRAALDGAHGSVADAARRIGWTRQKLYRRMRAFEIETDSDQSDQTAVPGR